MTTTRDNQLATPELHRLLGYRKTKRLQFSESVPQLKGIHNSDCGMLELLYNSSFSALKTGAVTIVWGKSTKTTSLYYK